jgi:hypothetical protein
MANLLQTGATWLGTMLASHAGTAANYLHGEDLLEVNVTEARRDSSPAKSLSAERDVTARFQDFTIAASSLAVVGDEFLPTPLDEIEFTEKTWVVFPLVNGRCFRFMDHGEALLRIYAVDQESMVSVAIVSGGNTYNFLGVPSTIRGAEQYDGLDTTKLLTTSVYLLRSQFEENGITTPPIMASIDVHDLVGWSVDMAQTEWGETLVKLGLQRETLTREWQARRNAAV